MMMKCDHYAVITLSVVDNKITFSRSGIVMTNISIQTQTQAAVE